MMYWRRFQELQKVAEVGERFISYVEAGEGSPVVLLHGAPTWGYLFHRVLPELERRHRVLVPDLPGYGFSDRDDRFSRSLARQSERVAAWLQAIGVDRAAFVGHELGAALALHLAMRHPERVESLTLIGAVAYGSFPAPVLRELREPEAAERLRGPALNRRLARALAGGFATPEPEALEGLLAPYGTDVGRLSLVRSVGSIDCSETLELTSGFSRLRARTLVLWGERDAFQPLEHGKRLARDIPHAALGVLEGAGHFCPLDSAAETSRRLMDFLGPVPSN